MDPDLADEGHFCLIRLVFWSNQIGDMPLNLKIAQSQTLLQYAGVSKYEIKTKPPHPYVPCQRLLLVL